MRCDSCGAEMTSASPFAEFWYWQSDGVGGFVSFCAGCARRTQDARAQAARIMTRIAQGLVEGPDRQDYILAVRTEDGAIRLRMRMSLDPDPTG